MAKLWVKTTTTTVAIMTIFVDRGCFLRSLTELHEKVPIDTMIITATKAAMGICLSHSSKNTIKINKKTPAEKVDKRPRPPDFTLITDCPIIRSEERRV